MKNTLFTLAALFLFAANSTAQVTTKYELSLEGAKKIMDQAMAYAQSANAPGGAIAIVDDGGYLIMLSRISGTFPVAAEVAHGKARTAAIFRMPSKNLEDGIIKGRGSLVTVGENMLRGGLPILYNGKVVGGIGVSGAASADQDVEIAEAGLLANFQ